MKIAKLIPTLVAAAFVLTITPAWAMEQDTGYPWFGDLPDNNRQTVSQSGTVAIIPVSPSEEDSGYPWFADIKDDHKAIQKPITIFKSHPRSVDEDSGYPWHADIKGDNPMQTETMIQ